MTFMLDWITLDCTGVPNRVVSVDCCCLSFCYVSSSLLDYSCLLRALYDRVAEVEQELSFKKDDILYVEDTLPNGCFGYWVAWQLDENAQRLKTGQIPSKYM